MNSSQPLTPLEKQMFKEFQEGKNADIEVHAGGQVFKVIKSLLFIQSDVFKVMFQCDLSEKRTNVVRIDGYAPGLVRKFLLYFYIGRVYGLNEICVEMYELAHFYEVEKLKQLCIESIYGLLNSGDIPKFYELAVKYELKELNKKCVNFIMSNVNIHSMFDFYRLAKKYELKEVEEKVVHFVKSNVDEVSKSSEWSKFDTEFKFNILQKFVENIKVVKSDNNMCEGTIRLDIPNFADFVHETFLIKNGVFRLKRLSNPILICGLSWNIMVSSSEKIFGRRLNCRLICNHEMSSDNFWSCIAEFEFRVCFQRKGTNNIVQQSTPEYFDSKENSKSFLIEYDKLLDEKNGFIKNGTIRLEADVKVKEMKGVPFQMLLSKQFV